MKTGKFDASCRSVEMNSCNSQSPIVLDTPERDATNNTSVIEITDGFEWNLNRRRRHDTVDNVILSGSPKRARVDVPFIDLTVDNDDDSTTNNNNSDSLYIALESPYYTEMMRSHYLPEQRLRIRRTLRSRTGSHHSRQQIEDSDHQSGRHQASSSNINHRQAFDSTILVDDDDNVSPHDNVTRPSCSVVNNPCSISSSLTSSLNHNDRHQIASNNGYPSQDVSQIEYDRRGNRSIFATTCRTILRNNRRLRESDCLERIPSFSSSSADYLPRTIHTRGSHENNASTPRDSLPRSDSNRVENNSVRLNIRTSSQMERNYRPYDFPEFMLPALLSWFPESSARHFPNMDEDREDYEALWTLTERLGQVKPRGLSKAEMEDIPAFRYGTASKDSSNRSCVICMMNYSNREKLRRLPCSHDFHAKCIDRWLKNNRSCPICRKNVTEK
ncbi:uncharacterized protein LOC124454270 isoform X2 [Xenia sp. Carnegie-2017]|uniref:uncharacterized protein LOC124454270 isoform X2 n=1 Tax=Xenia sp. Carnegie-2017 TaxID=2897299 RepID=UPI001F04360C|nr:uncharacterized protein LOC124454270 isoform X2 [Xenia sp. Carnegie-2017]